MNASAIIIIIAIGAAAVIEAISIFIKIPYESIHGFTAVIIIEPDDDPAEKLDSIFSRLRWTDNEMIHKILIVNNTPDSAKTEICNRYCTKNNIVETVNTDELLNLLILEKK